MKCSIVLVILIFSYFFLKFLTYDGESFNLNLDDGNKFRPVIKSSYDEYLQYYNNLKSPETKKTDIDNIDNIELTKEKKSNANKAFIEKLNIFIIFIQYTHSRDFLY